jgi:putative transposase
MTKKRRRHSPEWVVSKLRDAGCHTESSRNLVAVLLDLEACEATYHRWQNQFGGMKSEQAERLRELDI